MASSTVLAFPAAAIISTVRTLPSCDPPADVAVRIESMGVVVAETTARRAATAHDDEGIAILDRLKHQRPERTRLFVHVDDSVEFERLVRFLDAARGFGYFQQAIVLKPGSRAHWCGAELREGPRISCDCFCC